MDEPRFLSRDELAVWRPRLLETRCPGLYVSGSVEGLAAPCAAIVGSRAPSDAGRRLARHTASELATAGVCVVSGLALGIDAAAHEGALEAGAPTIGVLGGGHRFFFPPRNRPLAERMVAAGGGVVSPFEPNQVAKPGQFLARNALIAALADVVVVVEAAARSGSLNTAGWATDLGVPVLGFPGDVDRPKVAGCLALIRDGATLARNAADVLEALGLPAPNAAAPAEPEPASPADAAVLACVRAGITTADEIAGRRAMPIGEVHAALTRLRLSGHCA
jgi:DNA processing protein